MPRIHLRFTQAIGFARLARLFADVFGLSISEGALVAMLRQARRPFAAQAAAIRADLLGGDVVESDETGLRVGKANWWNWRCARPSPSAKLVPAKAGITNEFRGPRGATLHADIRSVAETARRRAVGALDATRLALAGQPLPINP